MMGERGEGGRMKHAYLRILKMSKCVISVCFKIN